MNSQIKNDNSQIETGTGDFKSDNDFRKFVQDQICQCYNQCIDLDSNTFAPKQSVCSEITKSKSNVETTQVLINDKLNQNNYYIKLINNALRFFLNEHIIFKNGVRYYLTENNLKLTWDNIKSIENEETKKLLWLLRKLIIDCIIKSIHYGDLKIFSVGSTSLSSDYDITLYGKDQDKIELINNFNIIFNQMFYDNSSLVFDTNIYGKAYISFDNLEFKEYATEINCDNQRFFYLKQGNKNSQLSWSLIKYINDIRDSFGEHIYNDLIEFMSKKLNSKLLDISTKTRRNLKNKNEEFNYNKILEIEEKILKYYKTDKTTKRTSRTDRTDSGDSDKLLTGYNDYISLINFYGIETYFTRGAFLDIVVNGQMCKTDVIELTEVDYISSILENAGFFFNHNNKTKYFIRVNNTLKKLIEKYPIYEIKESIILNNIVNNLKTETNGKINYDTNYCKWIDFDNDSFDLLKCEKYNVFNILFKIVYSLLKIYTQNVSINDDDFMFYNIFINNNNTKVNTISPNIQNILDAPYLKSPLGYANLILSEQTNSINSPKRIVRNRSLSNVLIK